MENIQNIAIDIMDNKSYDYIFANQYDEGRQIVFHVTEYGNPFDLEGVLATFSLKKPDGTIVYLTGDVDFVNATVTIVNTLQMTALAGNRIPYQLQFVKEDKVISTISGHMKVSPAVVQPGDIESSDEFNALTDALKKVIADYERIVTITKEYMDSAEASKNSAKESEEVAIEKAAIATDSADRAKASEDAAKLSEQSASASAINANQSKEAAAISEQNALASEQNALASSNKALDSELAAKTSETNAKTSELNAKASEDIVEADKVAALDAKNRSEEILGLVQTSEANAKESEDNAERYKDQVLDVAQQIGGALMPMGTIAFEDLDSQPKVSGYMYNIKNSFTTTSDFKGGAGIQYAAGTNVYYTSDGYWDILVRKEDSTGIVVSDTEPTVQIIDGLWLKEHN